jgi:hypothetical protein
MLRDSDPNPHSQYGSGSRTAKSVRTHADSDPQYWYHMYRTYLTIGTCSRRKRIGMVKNKILVNSIGGHGSVKFVFASRIRFRLIAQQ